MQGTGENNRQSLERLGDSPVTLSLGGSEKANDVVLTDAVQNKDGDHLSGLKDGKEEGVVDGFSLEDDWGVFGEGVEGFVRDEKPGDSLGLKDGFEQVREGVEGMAAMDFEAANLEAFSATAIQIDKKEDDGCEKWNLVASSKRTYNSGCDDSMPYESKLESDDSFDFDSDEEDGEKKDVIHNAGPSIVKAFDMELLRHCIRKGEESLLNLEGRDVILIVGKTGTGKSTLIQGIAGRTFTKSSFSCGGAAPKDIFDTQDPVSGFEIGHAKESMTKYIKCFFRKGGTDDEVVYLDTPGFEDTDGEEVDIATSVMLAQVARKSRTMRFVLMINYVSLLEDRGGSLRSILKFIHNFVVDFKKERKSFMVLFTHADEIKDVPDSIDGAKKSLLAEIIRTISGTKDDGVNDFLSFIRKSLEKGFPFVDVLHPLKTDYSSLTNLMEQRLKPTDRVLDGSGRCGLTISSQMRLSGSAQKLLRQLGILLNSGTVDVDEVCEIKNHFEYFEKYVDFQDMRAAVSHCKELLADHVTYLHNVVQQEYDAGTNTESYFTEVNVAHLVDAISQLDVIDSSFNKDFQVQTIIQRVHKFKEKILDDIGRCSFNTFHQDLLKLKEWSAFHAEFPWDRMLIDPLIEYATEVVLAAKNDVSDFDMSRIFSCSERTLQNLFSALNVLESVRQNEQGLSLHIDCVPEASEYLRVFGVTLKSHLKTRNEELILAGEEQIDFTNEQCMKVMADHMANLEVISNLSQAAGFGSDIFASVEFVRQTMCSQLTGKFSDACSDLKGTDFGLGEAWFEGLSVLRDVTSLFSTFKGPSFIKIESLYASVVDDMKFHLQTKSLELNEMSQQASVYSFVDGTRDGECVGIFQGYDWFDDFLPFEERFVRSCSRKIISDYSRILSANTKTLEGRIDGLENFVGDYVEVTGQLVKLSSIFIECGKFGLNVEDKDMVVRGNRLLDIIGKYITRRKGEWQGILKEWTDTMYNETADWERVRGKTECLDSVLSEIAEVIKIPCQQDIRELVKAVHGKIILSIENFKEHLESTLDSKVSYDTIALSIARVQAVGDFPLTSEHLPKFDTIKKYAHDRVLTDVRKVEDMVVETADFHEIDRLLVEVEKATILDQFLDHDLKSSLRSLKRLRASRQDDVEDLIKNMIEKNDFGGLKKFLEPMAKSKDLVERKKLQTYVRKMSESFKKMERQLNSVISGMWTEDSCLEIASLLKVLGQASDEVGEYLPNKKRSSKTNLKENIRKWKSTVNREFNEILKRMETQIIRADFVALVKTRDAMNLAEYHFKNFLTDSSVRKAEETNTKFTELHLSASSRINKFIDTWFVESKELVKILDGLKGTTNKNDPRFTYSSQCYNVNTEQLHEEVNKVLKKLKELAAEAQCYDDCISTLKDLKRSLDDGLRFHLPDEVYADCDTTTRKFYEARELELRIHLEISSAELELTQIAKKMDKLQSNSFLAKIWNAATFNSITYENLKMDVTRKVRHVHRKGMESLRMREFHTLNESLRMLTIMNNTVVNHVPEASSNLEDLKRKTASAFHLLCKKSQEALQSENYRAFEPLFTDYRGFVMNVTTLMEDDLAIKAFNLTNQFVYERMHKEVSSVEKELAGFQFDVMKQKIEEVRRFGGFLADRFSLFHEQLKGVTHVNSDRWLGMLQGIIQKYFQNGRDLRRLKFYAIIGVPPSADTTEIKQAYEEQIKNLRASERSTSVASKLEQMKEAMDIFEDEEGDHLDRILKPFDNEVRGVGSSLRETTRKALQEQHYEFVEKLLFKLQGIEVIENLVRPKLNTQKIRDDVFELVKNHVRKVRIEVDSNWSQRLHQELNHNISDLKLMQEQFKSHSYIFSESWNTGIVEMVQKEIDKLGKDAAALLQTRTIANESRDQFRRCFMEMGAVLVELHQFKDFTKKVMSDLLESCLHSEWGYGFVFDLGLSLHRGDDTNDENEVRIAQNLLTEFGHFKEVLTMVWNEETIQKPPEFTVKDIRGNFLEKGTMNAVPLDVDSDTLLEQFLDFETKYTSFLGEYLAPGADLSVLIKRIVGIADDMKPITCDNGFGSTTKLTLPTLIAGVFSLFTVLKSGESYNRLQGAPDSHSIDSSKLLMKPHNIQIMTLLCMFGCGLSDSSSLRSQLMQIRTGEGKSMILGAAATIFGLLGFQVRCICYSEYLSSRDYELFRDVFQHFGLLEYISYSKITTLSEETTAMKGNIREMTLSLVCGNQAVDNTDAMSQKAFIKSADRTKKGNLEEILLVDEVDVFFGSEFYGQTYNQVAELREPEVASILRKIWEAYKRGGKRLRLADIKGLSEYHDLSLKISGFEFLLENEIALMLDQVRRVDDELYYLDQASGKIGYKIQDAISYNVTFGYRTVFAYLKEADNGNLKDRDATLSRVLTMPISCGQFSYANIQPTRILGVSGTLEVMNDYQKRVLQKYGVNQYLYVPSVYGQSNFNFDKGGDGVSIERGISDFFQKIADETSRVATKQKRAVIVFFNDSKRLNEYVSSPFYRKLGRKKAILTENKTSNEKAFVISKAATAGQITICTAVFGRGTDFFSKDDALDDNGGVHVIQAFLSSDMSEEIQIQGRTARQGKKGSFMLILLDKDLEDKFGVTFESVLNWPRGEFYDRLCEARNKTLESDYHTIETKLSKATTKDRVTHEYFDALLDMNTDKAKDLLKETYLSMKKKHTGPMNIDLAFAIDITGSMAPYANAIASTIQKLLSGQNSILSKLKIRFPDSIFNLRVAVLGFRDVDDGNDQFEEKLWDRNIHFSEDLQTAIHFVRNLTASTSGGSDLAEDHLGAIERCVKWDSTGDWEGMMKAVLLITDAPAHGYAPDGVSAQNVDDHGVRHPLGLTMDSVVQNALDKDIDLFVCSFDPIATVKFEEKLSEAYVGHPSNVDSREVKVVPLVPKTAVQNAASGIMDNSRKHNIFVLDESGSMQYSWSGVVSVYNKFLHNRRQRQHDSDLISIVQFDSTARITCNQIGIVNAPSNLNYNGGGTCFAPAASFACDLARNTPQSHQAVVIFMSDGMANDSAHAAQHFSNLSTHFGFDIELHVIGFGGGTDTRQLLEIAGASVNGRVHTASDIDSLSRIFVQISGGSDNVANVVEAEMSKRISDAVTNRLSVEYLG